MLVLQCGVAGSGVRSAVADIGVVWAAGGSSGAGLRNRRDEKKPPGSPAVFWEFGLRFARHHSSRSANGLRYQKK
jgi:hypothetical protein